MSSATVQGIFTRKIMEDVTHDIVAFLVRLQEFYAENKRDMPWREPEENGLFDPYKILVSEFMLQQTQTGRVRQKYLDFTARFPRLEDLAHAPFDEVLELWSGLGYNRRARYLYDAARGLEAKTFPQKIDELTAHKGIGHNSAAAILTYAYDQRHAFIETNVRTVFIYEFFANHDEKVSDKLIEVLLRECVSQVESPRDFYWALMDYGNWLKKQGVRNIAQSTHYRKQSKFEGSLRQLRGEVLRRAQKKQRLVDIQTELTDERLEQVVASLCAEGLIEQKQGYLIVKRR
jgi:A/G-specific adenine glycosylase